MKFDLRGIITPVVTVFDDKGVIEVQGFCDNITRLIEHGVFGIFTGGGQGEDHALSADEKLLLLDEALETAGGRIPIMAGTGAPSTPETIALTKAARDHGADMAVVITPYLILPSQEELYGHYSAILDAVDIPLMIYNNPHRTGNTIQPETVARLCEHSSNLAAIKDSSGSLAMSIAYRQLCPPSFKVFMGSDLLIHAGLAAGLDGAVAGTSNALTDIVLGIYNEYRTGNSEGSREYQKKLSPLREYLTQETFPAAMKEIMGILGYPAGPCRLPLVPYGEDRRNQLRIILREMGILR